MSVGLKKKIRHQKNNIHIENETMKKIILLFILPLFLTGCPYLLDTRVGICITNNTSDTLIVCESSLYPDTILPETYEKDFGIYLFGDIVIAPNKIQVVSEGLHKFSHMFEYRNIDTLSLFMIRQSTIKKYSYEDIRKNNRILARYDLSLQDVEAFDGYFEYPPSQRMIDSGMKIYINPNNPDL